MTIPYQEAIRRWRGDDKTLYRNPVNVPPAWTNWFRKEKLPENIDLNSSVLISLGFSLLGFSLERFYSDKQGI